MFRTLQIPLIARKAIPRSARRALRTAIYINDRRVFLAERGRRMAWRTPQPSNRGGRIMHVVAHPDDDLLFLSPNLIEAIREGSAVTTVYVTSGDDGRGSTYWSAREAGARAAYAAMANVANVWKENDLSTGNRQVLCVSPEENTNISLIFLRLPDQAVSRSAKRRYAPRKTALESLYRRHLDALQTVDCSSLYTLPRLIEMLRNLIEAFDPEETRTQDFRLPHHQPRYGGLIRDHADHWAVARMVLEAHSMLGRSTLVGYAGYGVSSLPENIPSPGLTAKLAALAAYAEYDELVDLAHPFYRAWLRRQYIACRHPECG